MKIPFPLKFGPHTITPEQIFFTSKLSYGLVNLKPIVPGHVLVISKRVVPRFSGLTSLEVQDLFLSASLISKQIEKLHDAQSLTLTIQDGQHAGQSVPHIHLHLIPRYKGDWMNNDDIYGDIQANEREMDINQSRVDNDTRAPRSNQDMNQEASILRPLFEQYEDIWS
jgi:bis(5'-adenosyl)-triphosphatase